jgi:hypothetical protein
MKMLDIYVGRNAWQQGVCAHNEGNSTFCFHGACTVVRALYTTNKLLLDNHRRAVDGGYVQVFALSEIEVEMPVRHQAGRRQRHG